MFVITQGFLSNLDITQGYGAGVPAPPVVVSPPALSIQELLLPQVILPGIDKRLKDEIFANVESELEAVRQVERAEVIDLAVALFMED